jgi:hypothetical protein
MPEDESAPTVGLPAEGWEHEKYLDRAVRGKQALAAGYVTRQRWTDNGQWVYGADHAHPGLIDQDLWDAAQARIAVRSHRAARNTLTEDHEHSIHAAEPHLLRHL